MAGNDSWMYQGRQYHMWFGDGTKPQDAKTSSVAEDVLPSLQDRIHNVGHTLVAGLPASKRHHAVARLGAADHGRLDRLLTGVAHALPLGPRLIPIRVLGTNADAPGIGAFVKAGGMIRVADTHADLREATDLIGHSALEMGLDRFRPFLRQADDHLTQTGGMSALGRDVPSAAPSPNAASVGPRVSPSGPLSTLTIAATSSVLENSPLRCELPDGRIVPYLDLGNGFIAIPAEELGGSGTDFGSGFSIGVATTGTGMPTLDKFGGLAGGSKSGRVTSMASRTLRDLTDGARLSLLRNFSNTASVGGSIGKVLPVIGVLESFTNFLNAQNAVKTAAICKPIA